MDGGKLPRRFPAQGRPDAGNPRAAHRRGDGSPRRTQLEKICAEHGIAHQPGTVDIGVRVECRNEVMEEVNRVLYEQADRLSAPVQEQGAHLLPRTPAASSARRTTTTISPSSTATATRISRATTPTSPCCAATISPSVQSADCLRAKVGELTNMLANGHILVQRFGDILDGKRTWEKGARAEQRPPDPAGRGRGRHHRRDALSRDDQYHQLHSGGGYRRAGLCRVETLLYSPELKFYSNRVKMDEKLNTNVRGLHCLGDSSAGRAG